MRKSTPALVFWGTFFCLFGLLLGGGYGSNTLADYLKKIPEHGRENIKSLDLKNKVIEGWGKYFKNLVTLFKGLEKINISNSGRVLNFFSCVSPFIHLFPSLKSLRMENCGTFSVSAEIGKCIELEEIV